jgi:ORF6N domain
MSKLPVLKEANIASLIYFIRGEKVMLDTDLAKLYNVETRVLKQAVRRNLDRFPEDFMFELTNKEIERMVSQNVIPSKQIFGVLITRAMPKVVMVFAKHASMTGKW